ncbi:MAG: phosphatase PAP2 family protein [Bacteroidota bacterium]|nr:phosphatase PAP2 family protein [Bacteroidota bacterium]
MKIITVSITIFLFSSKCFSQNVQDDSVVILKTVDEEPHQVQEYNFFANIGNNLSEQAQAPFKISNEQAMWIGGGAVVTITLITLDQKIDNVFSPLDRHYRFVRRTSPQLTEFGGFRGIVATGAFGLYSIIWNDKRAQHTTLLITEALITSGIWTRIGKMIFSRERPSASYEFSHQQGGEWHWFTGYFKQGFETPAQWDAFPSGHTATAFAIASVVSEEYSDYALVAPIAYTIASGVGVTRLIEHAHWASDVFAGGVIGYLCGKQVARQHDKICHPGEIDTNVSLGVINDQPALQFSLKF